MSAFATVSSFVALGVASVMLSAEIAHGQFGPDSSESTETLDRIVAVVEEDVVTRSELNLQVELVTRQVRTRGGSLPPERVLERQVLERLIVDQLQIRAAEQRGIVIDDPTLNAAVESVAQRNQMSLTELRAAVEREGTPYDQYRERIRNELLRNRLRQVEVENRVQVTEQEVENAQTSGLAGSDEQYHIAQILIAVPEGAGADEIEQAAVKAQEVLAQLEGGAEFARLASAVSGGREALDGGDLGWRGRSQLPSLFVDLVPRLQPGQVSPPIRSPAGFHLVKLLEVRRASPAADDPSTQRQAVEEQLQRRKAEEEWELWLRRLRDEAYVEIRL